MTYVRYVSPPKGRAYGSLGRVGGAGARRRAAAPAARSSRSTSSTRTTPCPPPTRCCAPASRAPLVDLRARRRRLPHRGAPPRRAPRRSSARSARARLVLANSDGIAPRRAGARRPATRASCTSGTDLPRARAAAPREPPTLVTVAHLVARKRHADVLRALWALRERHPDLRYLVIGDGPERERARARSPRELGLEDRVEFTGQLAARRGARARARAATLFVMPSVDEAFGVAYVEAMAGWVPGDRRARRARPGGDRRALGDGHPARAARATSSCSPRRSTRSLDDPGVPARARRAARGRPSSASFTWEACGRATVAAYEEALRAVSDRPVLLVTNHVPARPRAARCARCTSAQGLEVALFDGRLHHATGGVDGPRRPAPAHPQREASRARGERAPPRGDRHERRARRAARRLPRRAPRRRPVPLLDGHLGAGRARPRTSRRSR